MLPCSHACSQDTSTSLILLQALYKTASKRMRDDSEEQEDKQASLGKALKTLFDAEEGPSHQYSAHTTWP